MYISDFQKYIYPKKLEVPVLNLLLAPVRQAFEALPELLADVIAVDVLTDWTLRDDERPRCAPRSISCQ
jgi:hypothetical protein